MQILRACSYKAVVALAMAGIIVASTAAATSAAISNPGPVTMFANATLHNNALDLPELQLLQPASGTVDSLGNFVIAQPDLTFETQDTVLHAPGSTLDNVTLHATLQPASDFVGIIDPEFGTMNLSGSLVLVVSADGLFTNCPVGPISVNLQTSQPGGAVYNALNGSAIVADTTFSIPAIPVPQPECAGSEAQLNGALGLESAPGATTLLLALILAPAVLPVIPTTTTTTTTTTPETTTTATTSPPSSSTSATSGATTTAAATTTRATTPTTKPRAAAVSPPKAPAATSARATNTTPPPTTGPPTTPPLQDRRAVVTPMTVPDTSAPAPAPASAPHQLAADARAVSDRFISGPAMFALALALSGIGVCLIGSELRAMRRPRRRRAARAH